MHTLQKMCHISLDACYAVSALSLSYWEMPGDIVLPDCHLPPKGVGGPKYGTLYLS